MDVAWACETKGDSTRTRITVSQRDVLDEGGLWPIATKVLVNYGKTETQTRIEWKTAKTEFITGKGGECPRYVFANYQDEAYGRFLLDPVSRKAVMAELGSMDDVFQRTLLWGSLWDSVREAEMDPREYINLALQESSDRKRRIAGAEHHRTDNHGAPSLCESRSPLAISTEDGNAGRRSDAPIAITGHADHMVSRAAWRGRDCKSPWPA